MSMGHFNDGGISTMHQSKPRAHVEPNGTQFKNRAEFSTLRNNQGFLGVLVCLLSVVVSSAAEVRISNLRSRT